MKKYRVNEIFYSVQAEGRNAGRAAAFVRFSGCNLDCPFCDTNHEASVEMTASEIDRAVAELAPAGAMVVFTGGEPTLQLSDDEELCTGRFRAIETNGIIPAPRWIDWVTISPKTDIPDGNLFRANEIKMLYGWQDEARMKRVEATVAPRAILLYAQPIADEKGNFAVDEAVDFVKRNPAWRLSLQWHKLFNIR